MKKPVGLLEKAKVTRTRRRRLRNAEPFKLSLLIALFLVSFALNWIWEMVQMPAFVETVRRSWQQTALQCAVFSLGDAALILIIYGIAVVAARRIAKIKVAKFYLLVSALGLVVAVFVELIANALGSWSYSERMPVLAGVGVMPILQLATLGPATLLIVSTWRRRHQIHDKASN
jgi:hypothetical protein